MDQKNNELKKKQNAINYIKDIHNYDPTKLSNEVLADDWRIVNAWFATKKEGKKLKHSLEDIINIAQLIYDEIVRRVKAGKMKHKFDVNKMKKHSLELYKIVSGHKIAHTLTVKKIDSNYIYTDKLYDITKNKYYVIYNNKCYGYAYISSVSDEYDGYRYSVKWINRFNTPLDFSTNDVIEKTDFWVTENIRRIHVLGCAALNITDDKTAQKHASIMLYTRAGNRIQIDAGNKKEEDPHALFITHAHPDHIGKIEDYTDIPIYAPEDVIEQLPHTIYDVIPLKNNESITAFGFIITPFKVKHSKLVNTYGYCIQDNQRKIIYLPDVIKLTPEAKSNMKNADMWIIDGSAFHKDITHDNYGHACIKTIMKWANELKPSEIYFIHLGKDTLKNREEVEKFIGKNAKLTKDNMLIETLEFGKYPEINEFKDMTIIKDFISIAGSYIDSEGKKFNDIDLIIRMNPPNDFIKRALYARFEKMLPKELFDNLHFVFDAEGPHSTFIPLYDLCLKRRDSHIVDMWVNITPLKPYLPSKPVSPAFYDIEKILQKLKL